MTKDELEQSIYARTRRFVDGDVLDAVLDLLAASRRAALEECEVALLNRHEMHKRAGRKAIAQWVKECYETIRALSGTTEDVK